MGDDPGDDGIYILLRRSDLPEALRGGLATYEAATLSILRSENRIVLHEKEVLAEIEYSRMFHNDVLKPI